MTRTLRLDRLTVTRGSDVLVSLTLSVQPGEVLTVMGPSGSGKSTALAAILGTLTRDFTQSGRVFLGDHEITALPPHLRRVGLLFQDDVLFAHLSVGQNLAFAIPPSVRGRSARRALIDGALRSADLAGFADRDPATLSGGQRARVALMRTLLASPRALLLDEPFSRLDTALRGQIRGFVLDRVRGQAVPAILVTHDAEDARAAAGRVIDPLGAPVALP